MDNNTRPSISIITAVLNGGHTLQKSIESVITQKHDVNIEYIVIDGGSVDKSVDIIKSYANMIDYWISEPDTGIFNAWNKGISIATGKYIAFLGADDFYYAGALKTYVDYARENPNLDYISSKIRYTGKHNRIIGRPFIWSEFRHHMTVAHVGSLHKRDLYTRFGAYDETLKIAGDFEFLLRAGKTLTTGYVDFISAEMDGGGISTRLAYKAIRETFSIKNRHKSCSAPVVLIDWVVALVKVWVKSLVRRS